jgi:hypothetical protein
VHPDIKPENPHGLVQARASRQVASTAIQT